jgi:hypothetical protein
MSSADAPKDRGGPPSSRDAPTVPPPALVSVVRFQIGAPVDELLYRMGVGDHGGAVDVAQELMEDRAVPIMLLPPDVVRDMVLEYRENLLLSFIDGHSSLEKVLQDSGLDMLDALRALCELLDQRVIAFG